MARDLFENRPPRDLLEKQPQAASSVAEQPFDFSLSQTAKNIPRSAKQFATNILTPFLQPAQTAQAVNALVGGIAEKVVPGQWEARQYYGGAPSESLPPAEREIAERLRGFSETLPESHEPVAEAAWQALVDRYGSIDNIQRTIQEDPVGFMADVSGVLTLGGAAAAKVAGKTSAVGKAAKTVEAAGRAADPFNIVASSLPLKWTSRLLMEKATKFRTTLDDVIRENMLDTMIKRGITPTRAGLKKAKQIRQKLGRQVGKLLDEATERGVEVPVSDLYDALQPTLDEMTGMRFDAPRNKKIITDLIDEYDEYIKGLNKETLTPKELQVMKRAAQKKVNWSRERELGDMPTEETFEAVSRFAKEKLEDIDPRIGPINKQLEPLMDLKEELPKVVHRISQRDPIGIMTPLLIGGGGVVGGTHGAGAGLMASILQRPAAMGGLSLLAEALRKGQSSTPLVLAHQALLQSGRTQNNPLLANALKRNY